MKKSSPKTATQPKPASDTTQLSKRPKAKIRFRAGAELAGKVK